MIIKSSPRAFVVNCQELLTSHFRFDEDDKCVRERAREDNEIKNSFSTRAFTLVGKCLIIIFIRCMPTIGETRLRLSERVDRRFP